MRLCDQTLTLSSSVHEGSVQHWRRSIPAGPLERRRVDGWVLSGCVAAGFQNILRVLAAQTKGSDAASGVVLWCGLLFCLVFRPSMISALHASVAVGRLAVQRAIINAAVTSLTKNMPQ